MDILIYTAVAAAAAVVAAYLYFSRFNRARPRANSMYVLVKDICANRWFLAAFVRRSPIGNEWVEPRSGFVLYTPAKPSYTDVVIGGKVYPAVEAFGCSPIYSTGDLAQFLKNMSIAQVAIGDAVIDTVDKNALTKLYSYLMSAFEKRTGGRDEGGGVIWVARRGGVKFAVAIPNYDKIAEIIGSAVGALSKATAAAGRTLDAIAETQRAARVIRRGTDWLWPLVIFGIMALVLYFVFGR